MKISALNPVSSVDGTEVSPCNQSGSTVRTTLQAIANLFKGTRGSAIASASSINLGAATGSNLHITGTTTITSLGTAAAGVEREVIFDGALILTHNATSLFLTANGSNITTAANDSAKFISEGSGNWRCVKYERANGQPLVAGGLSNPMTTSQDIIVGGSSGTPGRLAVGSNGQALVVSGGNLAYAGGEGIAEPVTALTNSSGTVAVNCALGDYFTLSLTANFTSLTFSNLPASGKAQTIMVEIKQDATGSRTATWPSSFKWSGSAPALSTAANSVDVLAITTFDQGTTWRATLAKGFA
jgi:hypothetical protein